MGQSYSAVPSSEPINVSEFSGRWYQISRNQNPFQDPNAKNAYSDFTLNDDGTIKTLHSETLPTGSVNNMEGIGYVDATGRNYRSETGDLMTIYEYMPDIGFSIIGDPNKGYFWIMSRDRYPEAYNYHQALNQLKKHGLCFEGLIVTYQDNSNL